MIPKTVIKKIAKEAEIKKISPDALNLLQKTIDEIAIKIALDAAKYAKYAKRKTIFEDDIKLAAGEK
ncbi:MAG: NFYB/HAP3 family transcription factor subunit [Candidatus Aenigmatarchaeota archaeon]|nr:NFYB/HAP3 family transcription factor subunit [Candidatus Aenigmarchaeota archaeon]